MANLIARQKLGDLLVQAGYINPEQLRSALEEQKQTGVRLGNIMVKNGYFAEQSLIEVLEFQLGIPHVVLAKRRIDEATINLVPENLVRKYRVFPVEISNDRLVIGMVDPTDVFVLDELRLSLKTEIQPVIITEEDLNRAINQYFGMRSSVEEVFKGIDADLEVRTEQQEEEESFVDEAPIVRLVNLIITQAVKERASDIHLEPNEKELAVRFRVDGRLRQVMTSPKNTQGAIISRIKIISGMNIAEKRVPQDGRIEVRVEGVAVDLRVSAIPTVFGEKIVMRLLFKNNVLTKMELLGFSPENLEKFRSVYQQPHGIILVTGPTGSGKSTTLSAVLNELKSPEVNIMTVEDPVEYQVPGVNQVQVNIQAGMTFALALRSFLRQDPDVIMVGEIRDNETAQISTQAALTGHLVLSTLHTNDAPSSITRLIDMKIEPFLVASTVGGIIAQRLVRMICSSCKVTYLLNPNEPNYKIVQDNLPDHTPDQFIFYHARGCNQCNNTGYSKRIAVHEVLIINPEVRMKISKDVSAAEIRTVATQTGMKTLLQDGLLKALAGKTTLEEVIRVTYTNE